MLPIILPRVASTTKTWKGSRKDQLAQVYTNSIHSSDGTGVARAKEKPHKLDPFTGMISEFEEKLRERVIGQPQAVHVLANAYQTFLVGMNPPNRPVSVLLFAASTA